MWGRAVKRRWRCVPCAAAGRAPTWDEGIVPRELGACGRLCGGGEAETGRIRRGAEEWPPSSLAPRPRNSGRRVLVL
eukprot:2916982-Prymnesium_polylepis.2